MPASCVARARCGERCATWQVRCLTETWGRNGSALRAHDGAAVLSAADEFIPSQTVCSGSVSSGRARPCRCSRPSRCRPRASRRLPRRAHAGRGPRLCDGGCDERNTESELCKISVRCIVNCKSIVQNRSIARHILTHIRSLISISRFASGGGPTDPPSSTALQCHSAQALAQSSSSTIRGACGASSMPE